MPRIGVPGTKIAGATDHDPYRGFPRRSVWRIYAIGCCQIRRFRPTLARMPTDPRMAARGPCRKLGICQIPTRVVQCVWAFWHLSKRTELIQEHEDIASVSVVRHLFAGHPAAGQQERIVRVDLSYQAPGNGPKPDFSPYGTQVKLFDLPANAQLPKLRRSAG
jgi:hypothetical protein